MNILIHIRMHAALFSPAETRRKLPTWRERVVCELFMAASGSISEEAAANLTAANLTAANLTAATLTAPSNATALTRANSTTATPTAEAAANGTSPTTEAAATSYNTTTPVAAAANGTSPTAASSASQNGTRPQSVSKRANASLKQPLSLPALAPSNNASLSPNGDLSPRSNPRFVANETTHNSMHAAETATVRPFEANGTAGSRLSASLAPPLAASASARVSELGVIATAAVAPLLVGSTEPQLNGWSLANQTVEGMRFEDALDLEYTLASAVRPPLASLLSLATEISTALDAPMEILLSLGAALDAALLGALDTPLDFAQLALTAFAELFEVLDPPPPTPPPPQPLMPTTTPQHLFDA